MMQHRLPAAVFALVNLLSIPSVNAISVISFEAIASPRILGATICRPHLTGAHKIPFANLKSDMCTDIVLYFGLLTSSLRRLIRRSSLDA